MQRLLHLRDQRVEPRQFLAQIHGIVRTPEGVVAVVAAARVRHASCLLLEREGGACGDEEGVRLLLLAAAAHATTGPGDPRL